MMTQNHNLCLVSIIIFLSAIALSPLPTFATIIPKVDVPHPRASSKLIPLPTASSKLVAQICNGASIENRRFCLKALSNPEARDAKDAYQLTKVVMKLAIPNAQHTLNVISRMAKQPGNSPQSLEALNTCLDIYTKAIESFGTISGQLRGDLMSASYDVSFIGPEAYVCRDEILAAKINAPRISAGIRFLSYYSSIGEELINSIQVGAEGI